MGTTKKATKTTRAALAAQLAAGVQKHMTAGTSLSVLGTLLTVAQIEAQLNGYSSLRSDVDSARAALKAKVAAETAQSTNMTAFIGAIVKIVRGMFGNQPDVLADFGLQPTKAKTPLTVEQKAAAAAKREATREARGTKGRKARQAIKGNVTGVTVTPVTAGQASPPAKPTATGGTTGTGAETGGNAGPGATTPTPHS